jgi:hypothetical protein
MWSTADEDHLLQFCVRIDERIRVNISQVDGHASVILDDEITMRARRIDHLTVLKGFERSDSMVYGREVPS